jgi:hypothetical protein
MTSENTEVAQRKSNLGHHYQQRRAKFDLFLVYFALRVT